MDGQEEDTDGSNIIQQERTKSPSSCCGSEKSDWSMNHPPHFKKESTQQERTKSPPSCSGSEKSDWSMNHPPHFKKESTQQERTKSPPSCSGSEKSDWSMNHPPHFKKESTQQERTKSPPSCSGSEKSDWSMNHPPHFKKESTQQERTKSPPSCSGSEKSDWSMNHPPHFKKESTQQERTKSPPSCSGSEKSDWSMNHPPHFKKESVQHPSSVSGPSMSDSSICHPPDMSNESQKNRSNAPSSCCGSAKSDWSINHPPLFNTERGPLDFAQSGTKDTASQNEQTDLSLTFKSFEDEALAFMKNEIEKFQRLMSPDYIEDPDEQQTMDTDRNEKAAKDGALKIALHILRAIKREELANLLEKRLLGELSVCQSKLKPNLKRKSQNLFEGIAKQGNPNSLKKIYTELYITESGCGEVNNEHEVRQMESASWKTQDAVIKSKDIFKPGQDKQQIRTVLTKGIAGIGKTVCSQKYILDWAEGIVNKTIDLIFPFPFRELNLMKDKLYSLLELIQHFFVEVKEAGIVDFSKYNVVLVFDGLDESRFSLHFGSNEICCDITQPTTVDALLTNLIQGNLLPSAHIWITSRPAAANKIPSECVDRVTEVRGFKDPQKEEFFRKRLEDQTLANQIVAHIKTTRSLHIMCHIPVFCFISATVLENILTEAKMSEESQPEVKRRRTLKEVGEGDIPKTMVDVKIGKMPNTLAEEKTGVTSKNVFEVKIGEVSKTLIEVKTWEMPKTLTQMYVHFLIFQLTLMDQKYPQQDKDQVILLLGKLAYQQLETGHLLFYESDLKGCGIDVKTASVYSGICTQIFREEKGLYQEKMYCFVHLSIQEFLAALYVFLVFVQDSVNLMAGEGHDSVAAPVEHASASLLYKSAVDKALRSDTGHLDLFLRFLVGFSVDTTQNLLQGLLRQHISKLGVSQETTEYIKEKIRETPSAERCINLFHCLGELNDHSLVEEIQAFLNSGLSDKDLSSAQWSALVFVLLSSEEELEVFDLKKYSRSEAGLQRLLPVVKASKAALLDACSLSERCCEILTPALSSNASQLKVLDLSDNDLQETGIKKLCIGLKNPHCKLESLRLNRCSISGKCCDALVPVLSLISSKLRVLDLSDNDMLDFGVKVLCGGLSQPQCTLECLRLSFCGITREGCDALASAIESNPSSLKELDLSYNHPGKSGVRLLSELKEDPMNKLEKLRVDHDADCWLKSGLKNFVCDLTLDANTVHKELTLSEDLKTVMKGELQDYPDHPERFESCAMVLCKESLSGRCYWEIEWSRHAGDLAAYVGVAYKRIPRKGGEFRSLLGRNEHSWSIRCADDNYMAWHNRQNTIIPVPAVYSNRLGLYLDWPAGILSFYSVTSNTLTHLHTFQTEFEAPVYAAFRLWADDSSVSLCPVEKPSAV